MAIHWGLALSSGISNRCLGAVTVCTGGRSSRSWAGVFGRVTDFLRLEGNNEMFYLTTHSTHFYLRLYGVGHMVKDHTEETRCRHCMVYPFQLAARDTLYAPFYCHDNTYHGLCYNSRGSLAGMRKS